MQRVADLRVRAAEAEDLLEALGTSRSGSVTAPVSMLIPMKQVSTYDMSVRLTAAPIVGPKEYQAVTFAPAR